MSLITRLVKSYAQKENDAIMKSIEIYRERLPLDVTIVRGLSCESPDGPCHMTVYHPTVHEKLPIVINIHGGGMVCGVMEQNDLLCAKMAREGYLVVAIDYPLMPEADVFRMYRVLAYGINYVGALACEYNGDLDKVYWTGDSAGGYLITNLAGLRADSKMREIYGVPEIKTPISALGIISGMLYTNKKDPLGMVLPKMMFGKGYKRKDFYKYTNLERPEFIDSLPPVYMVSSADDMLKEHTLSFHKALVEREHEVKLRFFDKDKRLVHAFVALYPDYPESELAYREMLEFFEESLL